MPLLLQVLPHAGTIPGLALFLPLPHILGHPGGPHLLKGSEPLAQGSLLVLGLKSLRSPSHQPIRALLKLSLWTCPQPHSSGDPTCTTTLFQKILITVRGICVGLRAEYPIWLEHKCSRIYNFYGLTHQGSHAFHKNRRRGKQNLPLVDRFVKPSKSASWFIRIFKCAAFLKSDHPLQVSTHEQIMNDLVES